MRGMEELDAYLASEEAPQEKQTGDTDITDKIQSVIEMLGQLLGEVAILKSQVPVVEPVTEELASEPAEEMEV